MGPLSWPLIDGAHRSRLSNQRLNHLTVGIKGITADVIHSGGSQTWTSLLLYLSASNPTVGDVLVQEKEEERKLKQILVYFASKALSGSKLFTLN